jgi:hypothetical protein
MKLGTGVDSTSEKVESEQAVRADKATAVTKNCFINFFIILLFGG